MPVGFNSPARNLFLLGSSGAQVVSNFFESISKASTTDGVFIPDEIRYIDSNKKYALAGSAADSNSKGFGWFERQDYNLVTGSLTTDYSVRIESSQAGVNTTLRAMELDSNNNLIVVGKTADIPWIAKYSNAGVIDWQSTTNSADVEYTGITSDSSGNYYACGSTPTSGSAQAFVEKFDSNGNPGWGKSAFMLGRDVVLEKISANSGGYVVAVGYLEDDSADKGYIVKIDTTTGEVLWDRTLERNISGYGGSLSDDGITPAEVRCTACYIDSRDQIYVVGSVNGNSPNDNGVGEFLIKYSPEGNIVWQKERGTTDTSGFPAGAEPYIIPFDVKSDGETEQTVVLSLSTTNLNTHILLSKYSKNGDLVFRRMISKGIDQLGAASLDADPSFYYFIFTDQQVDGLAGEPDRYTFGKVSTSGNGFGNFQYNDGTATLVDYTIVSSANSIGRLSDGSVTNSVSDLITYPFTANNLLFDDLATHISNKKRQMDSADSFEYSGSPAIRPADFQELNLLGSTGFVDETTVGGGTTTLGAQTWSNDLTTANPANGFLSGNPATLAFDGATTNNTNTAATNSTSAGNQIVWSPSQFPAANGPYTLEVLSSGGGNNGGWGQRLLKVNGTTYYDPAVDPIPTDYITVSNLTEITEVIIERQSGTSGRTRLDVIKVNGTELIDGQGITLPVASTTVSKVKDQSGKGNDGVVNGATHNAAGYWEFDGTNKKISVLYNDTWTLPGDFTLEAWIYRNSAFNTNWWQDSIMGHDDGSGQNNKWVFSHNGTSLFFHTNTTAGSAQNIQAPTGWVPTNSEWYNVVVTRSGNTYTFYQNSTSLGSVTNSAAIPVASAPLTIGNAEGGGLFDGRIGEVRIYPRALTAAAVFQNYNATKESFTGVAASTDPGLTSTRTP